MLAPRLCIPLHRVESRQAPVPVGCRSAVTGSSFSTLPIIVLSAAGSPVHSSRLAPFLVPEAEAGNKVLGSWVAWAPAGASRDTTSHPQQPWSCATINTGIGNSGTSLELPEKL